ncbi:MAG: DUF655 domain-containing protein, partial [Thermoplasmata archaeon]
VAPPIDHVRGDAPRHRRFINGSRFMSRRLELLPRVGTKTMQAIGDEPRSRPFENFADLEERVRLNPPEKLVVECIEQEPTRVEETHRTFVTE